MEVCFSWFSGFQLGDFFWGSMVNFSRCKFLADGWTTHLKNMLVKLDSISPRLGLNIKKYSKPPSRFQRSFEVLWWCDVTIYIYYIQYIHHFGTFPVICCLPCSWFCGFNWWQLMKFFSEPRCFVKNSLHPLCHLTNIFFCSLLIWTSCWRFFDKKTTSEWKADRISQRKCEVPEITRGAPLRFNHPNWWKSVTMWGHHINWIYPPTQEASQPPGSLHF